MTQAAVRRVPLSRPSIGEREEELVLEVLRSGRLSLGPMIERFEERFAERVDAPFAAACSSGTPSPTGSATFSETTMRSESAPVAVPR